MFASPRFKRRVFPSFLVFLSSLHSFSSILLFLPPSLPCSSYHRRRHHQISGEGECSLPLTIPCKGCHPSAPPPRTLSPPCLGSHSTLSPGSQRASVSLVDGELQSPPMMCLEEGRKEGKKEERKEGKRDIKERRKDIKE